MEKVRQLYSKAEQLLIWVTRLTKLIIGEITAIWNSFGLNPFIPCQLPREQKNKTNIQKHFVTQVTGERGSLGGLGVPNTVEEATAYQVVSWHLRVRPTIIIEEREKERSVGIVE